MSGGAVLSDDGRYRYRLWRDIGKPAGSLWDATERRTMCFVMLNPSTADATKDDQTIKRCMFYAEREGCNRIDVVNQYAYRATQPDDLWDAEAAGIDIVGPDNREHWCAALPTASIVVAAWGVNIGQRRATDPRALTAAGVPVVCLGHTKHGYPRHPSRLGNDQLFERWAA